MCAHMQNKIHSAIIYIRSLTRTHFEAHKKKLPFFCPLDLDLWPIATLYRCHNGYFFFFPPLYFYDVHSHKTIAFRWILYACYFIVY